MIRQAISCDVCGTEKQHTNHWFVAYDMGGELRISAWNSRNRLRAGAKHLCGQTCLHKLIDEFVARTLSSRVQPAAAAKIAAREQASRAATAHIDGSLTSTATYAAPASPDACAGDAFTDEFESSARLITPPEPALPARSSSKVPPRLAAVPSEPTASEDEAPAGEPPSYSSRNWHAEAWKREREREQRAAGRHPANASHRRFIA